MYMRDADGEGVQCLEVVCIEEETEGRRDFVKARVLVVATTDFRRRNSRCIIGRQPCSAGLIANG